MKHPEIDDRLIAEHYVAGKLSPVDEAQFEEHYLNCPQCIRAVKDAERLQRGLGLVASEETAVRQTILTTVWSALRSKRGLALAASLLVLGLLPLLYLRQQLGHLGSDLDAARQELIAERQPRINTPILSLVPTRAGEQPLQQISLLAEPEWIVLAVELGESARPRYEATLTAHDGTVVLASSDLAPSFRGTVAISLYSSDLPPGEYLLRLTADQQELAFPLRVVEL